MKFALKSLAKYVDLKDSPAKIAELYTNAGLEVESVVEDVLDISVPPNRADCLGLRGLAREAAALTDTAFTEVAVEAPATELQETIDLHVAERSACPKYLGRIIKGVNTNLETPAEIRQVLETAGISCISPIVDLTNYVMLEYGQPLHAFDLDRINGGITVRTANAGESVTLLDSSVRTLPSETLVIADNTQVLAIAGIMGAEDSAITTKTKNILLECAYFDPNVIRKCSRNLGLQTESSYRFERCIDPGMQIEVMDYITDLILATVGGQAGPIAIAEDNAYLPMQIELTLRTTRAAQVLGMQFSPTECGHILRSLGMEVRPAANLDDLTVEVPLFRQDITREVDLIEEIARINGYDKIPTTQMLGTLAFIPQPEAQVLERQINDCLINRGYQEAITYSFIDSQLAHAFVQDVSDAWCLTNPIANNMNIMRPTLLPGLVQAVLYNLNRQQTRVRLYEIGLRFVGGQDDLQQVKTISGVCTGNYYTENWTGTKREVDFFDVKQDVCSLLALARATPKLDFIPTTQIALHPGQSADILLAESKVGIIGAMHPALQKSLGISQPIYMFEIDYTAVAQGEVSNFAMFSKFPSVRRDLALLVDRKLPVANITQAIRLQLGALLADLKIFDMYAGTGIPAGQKSLGLGIVLQDQERTLQETEVNDLVNQLVKMLGTQFKAVLR